MAPINLIIRVHGETNIMGVKNYFEWTLIIKPQWTGYGRLIGK
jgi:hypothetical protein